MRGSEFAELQAFVEIVEQGNFSRAAAYLGLAPSTLSQTIRSLEQRLGVRLLQRTTRSISLTEAGEHLLARIRPIFEEIDLAVESINDFRDVPMGTLRLSVSAIPAQMIIAPLLKDFLVAYPQTQIQLCIVHMVRNSLKYVSWKDYKAVTADLKMVYQSTTEEIGLQALDRFAEKWDGQYPPDQQILAQQLAQSQDLLRLSRRYTQSHLHHQCDRVLEQRDSSCHK